MGLTEEQKQDFKKRVYDPYCEAWNVIKWMRDTEPKDDKFWEQYTQKALDFPKAYGNSEIVQSISRVILDAGSEYRRL